MNVEKIIKLNNRIIKCIDIDDVIVDNNNIIIYFKKYCYDKYDDDEIVVKFHSYINKYESLIDDDVEFELIVNDDDEYIIELTINLNC